MRGLRPSLIALALVFGAGPALAHTKSETHSIWRIVGPDVHVTFTVPDIEAKRLATPDGLPPTDERMGAYLASHLLVLSGGKPCARTGSVQPTPASAEAALEAELEAAVVDVTEDACAGSETVALVDSTTGRPLVTDTQSEPADAAACGRGSSTLTYLP